MNWRAHHIDNAYEFDIAAHAKRLAAAIAGKSSAKDGHKVITMPLGNFNGAWGVRAADVFQCTRG